jgi:hypothetical protein
LLFGPCGAKGTIFTWLCPTWKVLCICRGKKQRKYKDENGLFHWLLFHFSFCYVCTLYANKSSTRSVIAIAVCPFQ